MEKKAVLLSELNALRAENAQLKKALTENEARVEALVHGIPDLVWLKDTNGVFLNCNPAFEHFFGATEAEIVGKTDYDFVSKELADFFRTNDLAAMLADKPRANEEWVTYPDGQRVLLETIKTPLRNMDDELIGILGVARNITERKQIQDEVEFQRQVLLTQQETSPDAILIVDEEGKILTYNQQFVALWDIPEALLQTGDDAPVLGFVLEKIADAEEFLQKVKWLYRRKDQRSHDEIRLKDGRYIDRLSAPVSTKEKYFGRVWYFRDITERWLAREKLQASDDLLNKLAQNVLGFIYQFKMTPEGKFTVPFAGGAAEEYFGLSLDAVRQEAAPVFEKVHPDDLEEMLASIHESARTLQPWRHEFRTQPSPGVTKWLYATSMPEQDKDGNIIWYGFTTDLTESKRTQDALQESEARLTAIIDGVQEGICVYDQNLRYILFNPFFEKLTGFPAYSVLGRHILDVFPFLENQGAVERLTSVLETGEVVSGYKEYWFDIESTGKQGWVRALDSPLKDADGHTVGVITLVTDITEQLKTQKELKDLTLSLERQVEERTAQLVKAREAAEIEASATEEFMAEMSHEIRTPLNAIIGMTYLARHNSGSPDVDSYLDQIHASGQHLLEVVNEVLDISKIQAGKQTVSQSSFSVRRLLDYVTGTVEKTAADKGLVLAVELDPAMPKQLLGDSFRISQILINFMNNAIKFTHQGSVHLRALPVQFKEHAVLVRFEVEDTGTGISQEKLPRLFTPYEQLGDDSHAVRQGTGLGLVICKKLAKLMGGNVGVESRYQHGSIFSFEILLTRDDGASQGTQAEPVHLTSPIFGKDDLERIRKILAGCRVLLAEDNVVNQHVIKELLGLVDVAVTVAQDGEEALRLLSEAAFNIVLMDIRMPKIDGIEATRTLRQNPAYADLPVLALTANASEASRETCVAAGMNDYLQKPIDPERLFAALARYYRADKSGGADKKKATVPDSSQRLFELLLQIPELDVAAGMGLLMGRQDLYAGLARKIATEYAHMPEILQAALDRHDVEALTHHVHSMKSTFGSLGAHHIQKQCIQAEAVLTTGTFPKEASLQKLIHDITKLIRQLHTAIDGS